MTGVLPDVRRLCSRNCSPWIFPVMATYHYVPGKNEAMSMAKSAILQKEFRNERKMLDVSYRMFRFMVNPKQALIAEAKRLVKDALTGKI